MARGARAHGFPPGTAARPRNPVAGVTGHGVPGLSQGRSRPGAAAAVIRRAHGHGGRTPRARPKEGEEFPGRRSRASRRPGLYRDESPAGWGRGPVPSGPHSSSVVRLTGFRPDKQRHPTNCPAKKPLPSIVAGQRPTRQRPPARSHSRAAERRAPTAGCRLPAAGHRLHALRVAGRRHPSDTAAPPGAATPPGQPHHQAPSTRRGRARGGPAARLPGRLPFSGSRGNRCASPCGCRCAR